MQIDGEFPISESYGILGRFLAMEEAIRDSSQDGLIYEDCYVRVWREDGKVMMCGLPIRVPFQYTTSD